MRYMILILVASLFLNACGADTPGSGTPESAAGSTATATAVPTSDSLVCVTGLMLCRDTLIQLWDPKANKMYKVTDETKTLLTKHAEACQPVHYTAETTHAVVCGTVGKASANSSIQRLKVTRVDTVIAKTAENAGVPFEFWCRGTSPKWDLEICNLEGGIFYQNEGDGTGWYCAWNPPVVNGNKWTYSIPAAQGMNEALTLVIKKESASDGMSEKKYEYSAELSVKGKKFKGAAIRGTAPVMGPEH